MLDEALVAGTNCNKLKIIFTGTFVLCEPPTENSFENLKKRCVESIKKAIKKVKLVR